MKTIKTLCLVGLIFLFWRSVGNTQIIYSNNFTLGGSANISGTTPTIANNFAGGTSAAIWNDALGANNTGVLLASGTNTTTLGDSWLLPFVPQSGYIYTLTVSLTFTGNPGSWVGLGFTQNNPVNASAGTGRFADSPVTGYDWLILTEANGNVQYFTGPKANTPQIFSGTGFTGGPQTITAQVILDTTGSQWMIAAHVNGVQMGDMIAYTNFPSIGAVGITQTTLAAPSAIRWNNFALTGVASPPTTNTQIIYSNNFTLGDSANISGTIPTVANNFAGGASSVVWNDALGTNNPNALWANGVNNTTSGDSWLLPFYPQAGYIYTLTASLVFKGNPGSWVGLGFSQNNPANTPVGNSRFNDSAVTGYDWMILTEANGNVQYFTGPKANSPQIFSGTGFNGGPQTLKAQVVLNTIGSQWTITAYVNGVQMSAPMIYSVYPPIGAVGITQNTLTTPGNVQWNDFTLTATGAGPGTNIVDATVNFSPANNGVPLSASFNGMSYEKFEMTRGYFNSNNVPLVKLFSMIGPAVLRIGGGTVDQTGWDGISNTIPITTSDVDRLAGFIKMLPANWSVIYGINLLSNTPANCAAEANYVANALGSRLLGFEIGNEPEFGFSTYNAFLTRWRSLAADITNSVPGWAVTNGGTGWTLVGADAGQGQLSAYTDPFANDESGRVSLLTQHFYRAAGASTNDTIPYLLQQPDAFLLKLTTNIVTAAEGNCSLGARITECGSYSVGGVANVSDAYGAALWSLDFMFTVALNGGQGINFHGGGKSPYSPLTDNGTNITTVGPEFYGLKMFSLLPPGNVVPAGIELASNINFTAYGVRQVGGTFSALLNNKDASDTVAVTVNLGANVTSAQLTELTGPSLYSTSGFMLGGATINPDGIWNGGVQTVLSATNGQLVVDVPPASAVLLNPLVNLPEVMAGINGGQLILSWPTNYIGWRLESNYSGLVGGEWFPVVGSGNTNQVQMPIQLGEGNIFFRLSSPK